MLPMLGLVKRIFYVLSVSLYDYMGVNTAFNGFPILLGELACRTLFVQLVLDIISNIK